MCLARRVPGLLLLDRWQLCIRATSKWKPLSSLFRLTVVVTLMSPSSAESSLRRRHPDRAAEAGRIAGREQLLGICARTMRTGRRYREIDLPVRAIVLPSRPPVAVATSDASTVIFCLPTVRGVSDADDVLTNGRQPRAASLPPISLPPLTPEKRATHDLPTPGPN